MFEKVVELETKLGDQVKWLVSYCVNISQPVITL